MDKPFLLSIEIENMLSIRHAKIDLSKYSVVGIVGEVNDDSEYSNGAGKSSLLECMLLAWFGRGRTDIFNSLKDDADQGEIHFTWQMEEGGKTTKYKVIRKVKRTGRVHSRELYIGNSKEPFGGGKTETDKYIEKVLGMDYEGIIVSNYFMQRKDDAFSTLIPSKRKEYLKKIIGTSLYDAAHEIAKKKLGEVEARVASVESEKSVLQTELSTVDASVDKRIAEAEQNLGKCEETINYYKKEKQTVEKQLGKINQQIAAREASEKLVMAQQERLKRIEDSLEQTREGNLECQASLTEIENAEGLLKALPVIEFDAKKFEDISKLGYKLRESKGMCEGKIKAQEDMQKEADDLGEKCPTCKQKITKTHKDKIKKGTSTKIDKLKEEITNIDKDLQKLRVDYVQMNQIKLKKDGIDKQRVEYETATRGKDKVVSRHDMLKNTYDSLMTERTTVEKQYKDELDKFKDLPAIDEENLTKYRNVMDNADTEIAETEDLKTQYIQYISTLKATVARATEIKKRLADIDKSISKEADEVRYYTILTEGYSKNGIPALIVDNCFPILEENGNAILKQFDNKRLIEFSSLKSKVKGGQAESLDIWVHNLVKDTKRLYETYSGGESTGINIAIKKSLSDFLAHRKYKRLPFLILDEVFGFLDRRHRGLVIHILNTLKKDFPQIFVISHTELQSVFPQTIKAIKRNEDTTYV